MRFVFVIVLTFFSFSFWKCADPIINFNKSVIEFPSEEKFIIHEVKNPSSKEYYWRNFIEAKKTGELKFVLTDKENHELLFSFENFKPSSVYELTFWSNIKLKCNTELKDFVRETKKKLDECHICGRRSVLKHGCLNCGNGSFRFEKGKVITRIGEFDSLPYLIKHQTYWFEDENGKFNFSFDEPNVYEKIPNWKPSIE